MLRLPDRPINKLQLGEELAALSLPGFTGVARLSRDVDDEGRVILENGSPKKIAPYILVKSDTLPAAQKTAATTVVSNHIPSPIKTPDSPRFEDQAKAIEAATTLDEMKAAVAALTRSL